MELREYWGIARRWWWLLILSTLLAAGAAYLFSVNMTPTYEASTALIVGGGLDMVDPTTGQLQSSEKLAQTYAELIKMRPILEATMVSLGLPDLPTVSVSIARNTQIMRITAADSNPERAAATANELARQLILQSPSDPERAEQEYRRFVDEQLRQLEREIAALGAVLAETKDSANAEEVVRLQDELNARRATHSSYLGYVTGSSINSIQVKEPAVAPLLPTRPKVLQNTVLMAVVGFMLAAGAAFLIEYLDDSVKSQADVEQIGLPTLGAITQISSIGGSPATVALSHPSSHSSEAYRILYTNLRYSVPSSTQKRIFLVTSAGPGEGKTTNACNLALTTANTGKRTILVDADLRHPAIHKVFGCSIKTGLSSFLIGEADLDEVLRPTEVSALKILPSGPITPNVAELFDSPRMDELLDQLSERADVIIIDSPPLLAVADASILASSATGTILVVEAGETQLGALAHAKDVIAKVDGRLLGVILNRMNAKRDDYYGYSYDYSGYYSAGSDGAGSEESV